MAAKRRGAKRGGRAARSGAKPKPRAKAPARRKPAARSPSRRAAPRSTARPAKRAASPKAARAAEGDRSPAAEAVTQATLSNVQAEPLRAEAADALLRGETVRLVAGVTEDGARVETLLLEPSGRGLQSTGEWIHRGLWNGSRVVTDKGHVLDTDANCFCRDCEAAKGYTLDDDE